MDQMFVIELYIFSVLQKANSFDARWSHNPHYWRGDWQVHTRPGWTSTDSVVCCFSPI